MSTLIWITLCVSNMCFNIILTLLSRISDTCRFSVVTVHLNHVGHAVQSIQH